MLSQAAIPGNAKHALVARALMEDIAAGKYPMDTMLPSEPVLTTAFGVSRQTIRAALRTLRELGVIEGRQGVGSFVRSQQPASQYVYRFESAVDLLQYATTTHVTVLAREEIKLDAQQAVRLARRPGEAWWRLHTLRTSGPQARPIASSSILIPYAYGAVLKDIEQAREPIFARIQKRMDETITEIWQDICAVAIEKPDADVLGVRPGAPGLCIERRYFGRSGNLFEVSRSIHPTDIFNYSMRVRLASPG